MKKLLAILMCMTLLAVGFPPILSGVAEAAPEEEGVYVRDIVIYGGNASGIVAAIQAAKMGKTVAVVEPNEFRIGGLTTGGLSDTDIGNAGAIGGLALEFYQRVGAKYNKASDFTFEPKVALQVLEEWVAEYEDKITVFMDERLDLANGVKKEGTDITSITTESGKVFKAKVFLDCTYEGDLMAKADVSYVIGREDNDVYGETLNGITAADNSHNGVPTGISPYVIKDDPTSGLLPNVYADFGGDTGDGDRKVQAYNFRWTLTNVASNQVPAEEPDNYDESRYELLFRAFEANQGWTVDKIFKTTRWLKNGKVDSNNNSGISTDLIGGNWDYPEADYETRAKIIKDHEDYQRGLLWALQTNERIPENIRNEAKKWGLAADEFLENNNWPTQIYVREARRMVGSFVMTQHVCKSGSKVVVSDSVGMGSYPMDSHHIQYVVKNGEVRAEGDFFSSTDPYAISYRSIVPKANECTNLLVPVCISASHAAYGSIRMEPVFMVLGQSAATAACLAIDSEVSVQNVNYNRLSERLLADNQVLYKNNAGTKPDPDQTGTVVTASTTVHPIETLPVTTWAKPVSADGTEIEFGLFDTAYAAAPTTQYNRVKTAAVGQFIEFTVDVPAAGTYEISAESFLHQSRAKYKLYLPETKQYIGEEKDQYCTATLSQKFDDPERVQLDTFGNVTVAAPGKLRLRFEVTGKNNASTGYTLAFCDIQLKDADGHVTVFPVAGLYTTTLEQAEVADIEHGYYDTAYAKEPSTKYDRALTTKVGDYVEYTVELPKAGTYTIGAQTYLQEGRGKYKLYLPDLGTYLGEEDDQYGKFNDDVADRVKTVTYGDITVDKATSLRLRFEVTGKNSNSKGYTLAFCNLLVTEGKVGEADGLVEVNSNGGSLVADVAFDAETGMVNTPDTPERAGYHLVGWCTDMDLTTPFDPATDKATETTVLYAKWEADVPETHLISFVTNYGEGGSGVGSQHIANGERPAEPVTPKREGYTFMGWYTDPDFKTSWNETAAVTEDAVVYALWMKAGEETPVEIDRTGLKAVIDTAKELSSDGYSTADWQWYLEKIGEAQTVYNNPDATQSQVNKAASTLQDIVDGMPDKKIPDNVDILLSTEVTSGEGHAISAKANINPKADFSKYGVRDSMKISLKLRVNKTANSPALFANVPDYKWVSYIVNGTINLYSGSTKIALGDINGDYKLSCRKGILTDILPGEYFTVTFDVPDGILEKGLTQIEVFMYNDLHNLAKELDAANASQYDVNHQYAKVGASLSIADVMVHLGDEVDISAMSEALEKARVEVVKTDVYTPDSLTALQRAIITAETQLGNTTMTQTDVNEVVNALNKALAGLASIADVRYGDVDGNGEVTANDALRVLQSATNKITLTADEALRADVDESDGVTAGDALQILQYATKKIAIFPVEG